MSTRASENQVELSVDYADKLPRLIIADPTRVRQIAVNLVGNALKFTKQGSVRVCLSEVVEDSRRFIRIAVIDTGIGIPPEKQVQLFQKFTQADSSTTRRFGGTGLGLAICKRLTEIMGGSIGLESEQGRGSTFWFTVPLVEAQKPEVQDAAKPVGTAEVPQAPQSMNLRVLVAEDNAINYLVAVRVLEKFGCHATVATNGREAVRLYQTHPYDLILMDCQMPEMDGYEAAAEIRRFEQLHPLARPRIPIIALTASAMHEDKEICLRAGMDDRLTKPFRPGDLKEIIKKWITLTSVVGG